MFEQCESPPSEGFRFLGWLDVESEIRCGVRNAGTAPRPCHSDAERAGGICRMKRDGIADSSAFGVEMTKTVERPDVSNVNQ
jgi:hypothetical protein